MKAETYIALNSDMRINTQFKNTLNNYSKSEIWKKKISVAACRLGWKWFTIHETASSNE